MFSKKMTPDLCRRMRKQAGLSQEELGDLMGWSKRTVVKREKEEFKLSLKEFEQFMIATSKSTEERKERKEILKQIGSVIDRMIGTSDDAKV